MLDRKSELIEQLTQIQELFMKLSLIKQQEYETFHEEHYDILHEFTLLEGELIRDITHTMKRVIPELLYFKHEPLVRERLDTIADINRKLFEAGLALRREIITGMNNIKRRIALLDGYIPQSPLSSTIVNLRA